VRDTSQLGHSQRCTCSERRSRSPREQRRRRARDGLRTLPRLAACWPRHPAVVQPTQTPPVASYVARACVPCGHSVWHQNPGVRLDKTHPGQPLRGGGRPRASPLRLVSGKTQGGFLQWDGCAAFLSLSGSQKATGCGSTGCEAQSPGGGRRGAHREGGPRRDGGPASRRSARRKERVGGGAVGRGERRPLSGGPRGRGARRPKGPRNREAAAAPRGRSALPRGARPGAWPDSMMQAGLSASSGGGGKRRARGGDKGTAGSAAGGGWREASLTDSGGGPAWRAQSVPAELPAFERECMSVPLCGRGPPPPPRLAAAQGGRAGEAAQTDEALGARQAPLAVIASPGRPPAGPQGSHAEPGKNARRPWRAAGRAPVHDAPAAPRRAAPRPAGRAAPRGPAVRHELCARAGRGGGVWRVLHPSRPPRGARGYTCLNPKPGRAPSQVGAAAYRKASPEGDPLEGQKGRTRGSAGGAAPRGGRWRHPEEGADAKGRGSPRWPQPGGRRRGGAGVWWCADRPRPGAAGSGYHGQGGPGARRKQFGRKSHISSMVV
jgi:hypothetical protein